jgi:hypothetical protein
MFSNTNSTTGVTSRVGTITVHLSSPGFLFVCMLSVAQSWVLTYSIQLLKVVLNTIDLTHSIWKLIRVYTGYPGKVNISFDNNYNIKELLIVLYHCLGKNHSLIWLLIMFLFFYYSVSLFLSLLCCCYLY